MESKYKIRESEIEKFLKLTGAKRSELTGIPRETWSRWKKGDLPPNTSKIREMAPKFGLTYLEMFIALEELRVRSANQSQAA